MKLCLLRGRAFLVDDQHGSANGDLGIDRGDDGARSADTAVRGRVAWHASDMVAYSGSCQAHPEGHGGPHVFSSFGNFVDAGIGIFFDKRSFGVIDFSVEVGALDFEFFEDLIRSCRSSISLFAGGDGVVNDDLLAVHELSSLRGEVDVQRGVVRARLGKEGIVAINAAGFSVAWLGGEMRVGPRWIRVVELGAESCFLFRVGGRGTPQASATGDQSDEGEEKESRRELAHC